MGRTNWVKTALVGLAIGSLPGVVLAQTPEPMRPLPPLPSGPQGAAPENVPLQRGQTILDRPRPEVDPLGVRLGTYFLFPRAEIDEAYNDNIFAQRSSTGDFVTILAPSFDLLSNFPRHALNVHGGAAMGFYASHSSEDYKDAFGAVDARYDITNNHHLTGGLKVERLHEDRASPDSPAPGVAAEPVKYNAYTANIGAVQDGTRIGWLVNGSVRREEYEAVPAVVGGVIPQSDRNLNTYEGTVQGSYEFVPNYQGFVRGSGNVRAYDHSAIGALTRNSTGWRIDGGARIDLTGITYAEVFVGYLQQDYRASQFGTVSGVDFGGKVVWNVTQLTSVTLNALRTVQDSNTTAQSAAGTLANSPAYLHSVGSVSVDHELFRNLLLNGNVSYANDDFKGIDRTDNVYGAGIGAKYLLNRHLYLGASYNIDHRDSSGGAAINPYTRNIFLLRLSTQL